MSIVLCPKCNGQKHVWVPPWVPGDQETYVTSEIKSYPCPVCEGTGYLQPLERGKENG